MDYGAYMRSLIYSTKNVKTLEEWAKDLGMTTAGLRRIINGDIKTPSKSTLDHLSVLLNQPIIQIIYEMFFFALPSHLQDDNMNLIDGNAAQMYLCYLYLQGYNINKNCDYKNFVDYEYEIFAGTATKKRELGNTIHVTSYLELCAYDDPNSASLNTMLLKILNLIITNKHLSEIKRLDIVVDQRFNPGNMRNYELSQIPRLPLKFKLNFVFFDTKSGKVEQVVNLS